LSANISELHRDIDKR